MGMMVFQGTCFADALVHLNGRTAKSKTCRNLKSNVYINTGVPTTTKIDPVVTLTLHNLKATRKGLRLGKSGSHKYITWQDVTHIPDYVGRILDSGGTILASTITIKAKIASDLHLI